MLLAVSNSHYGKERPPTGLEVAMARSTEMVSYKVSVKTVAISVILWLQFAIECLGYTTKQGGWLVWGKFEVEGVG